MKLKINQISYKSQPEDKWIGALKYFSINYYIMDIMSINKLHSGRTFNLKLMQVPLKIFE